MYDQDNENTAAAEETEGVTTPAGGFATNPQGVPLRESYRNAVSALMRHFDAQGIPYRARCEELGICLTVGSDIPNWQPNSWIRLGAYTGAVIVYTWLEQFYMDPKCAWMVKRLVDAVNTHCAFAEIGYDGAMPRLYARTHVWYANAEHRPRDVEAAMGATGTVLLRTLREVFEMSANQKRLEDSVEALVGWLRDEEMRAVVELPEVEVVAADEEVV